MSKLYNLLFIVILILFSFGQLQRIQLTPSLAFYIHDIVIASWLASTVISKHRDWWRFANSLKKHTKFWVWGWLIGLIGNIVLALVFHFSTFSLLYLGRLLLYIAFGCSLLFTINFSKSHQRLLWALAGLVIAWFGILQYIFIPDTRFLWLLGWDDHYYRLISTQLDPNFTGILLVMTSYFLWSVPVIAKKLKVILTIPLIVAILLTYSRATYLALVVSALILAVMKLNRQKQVLVVLAIIVGTISLLFLPKPSGEGVNLWRTYSIEQRILSSQRALQSLNPYEWVMGRGLFQPTNTNPNPVLSQHAPFPDNLLVFLVVGLGIPGLLGCLYVAAKATVFLSKKDRYMFAAWIAVLVHSQFNHTLLQPFVLLMLIGGLTSLQTERHG